MPNTPQPDNASVFSRLTAVETTLAGFGQRVGGMEGKLDSIQASIAISQKTSWPTIIAALTLAGAVIAGIYSSLSSKTELWSAQAKMDMFLYTQPIVASSEQSRADRAGLHDRTESNSSRLAAIESRQAASEAALKETLRELESQFSKVGEISNMRNDQLQKYISLLWQKQYGQSIPQDSFQPTFHRN